MAPKKAPTKPLKSMEKPLEKPIAKARKMKKKKYDNYSIYLYKLLKQIDLKMGITRSSMRIMNDIVHDMMEKIAAEAGTLTMHSKRSTLTSREIMTASRLLVPGELGKHAEMEANKAIMSYHANKDN